MSMARLPLAAYRRRDAGRGCHRHGRRLPVLAAALAGLLAGCAGTAPSTAPPAPGAPPASTRPSGGEADGISGFERRQRDQAERAAQQGRLAEAALAWEVLTLLRPEHAPYRDQLARVRAEIDSALAEQIGKGAAARKRGELDGAAQHYLAALALSPSNDAAAEALRGIERDRQKRTLGRLGRNPLAPRPGNGATEPDPRVHATSARQNSGASRRPAAPAEAKTPDAKAADPKAGRPAAAASSAR